MFYKPMILSVTNQKGGVGKTTVSTHLAIGLAQREKKVLFLDMDPQNNASSILFPDYKRFSEEADPRTHTICATILDRKPLPVYESIYKNLYIVPSHLLLSGADTELAIAPDHKEARLKKHLDNIKSQYDQIIIDCPPNLGILAINAFVASDNFLVVIEPGSFAIKGISQLQETIEYLIKQEYEHPINLLGFLFNMKAPTAASKMTLATLRQTFGDLVLRTVIPRNTEIEKAQIVGKSVYDIAPHSSGAVAFRHLIYEIYDRYEK